MKKIIIWLSLIILFVMGLIGNVSAASAKVTLNAEKPDEITKGSKIEISVKNKDGNNIIKFIDNVEISSIGKTLMSNIEETIEEYANSIDKSEKINILMNILDKYM